MTFVTRDCSVCVVDGDVDSRSDIVKKLEAMDLTVHAFDSAEAFLESQGRRNSVCLILDLNLPGMNGLTLQRYLNQKEIWMPLVFMSSSADVASAVQAIQGGAITFLRKNSDRSRLISLVAQLVAHVRDRGALQLWRHPYAPSPVTFKTLFPNL